ncbi:hypothetical protein JHD50_11330 [Sulfurimonas sp. MAG313]|nr:hypothetical protein [Sulfurimonas sp. MAG313]MDF1881881.1 hypothetical protein [Sulfurimonas sp. MAG313]
MTEMEERAHRRRNKISLTKVPLHSQQHHSFHPDLELKKAWELLTRLSKEAWIEKTGEIPPSNINKSIVKFIHLHSLT